MLEIRPLRGSDSDESTGSIGGTQLTLDENGNRLQPDVVWNDAFGAGGPGRTAGSRGDAPADDRSVRELRCLRALTVVVCSSDEGFARAVGEVCVPRGHEMCRLESLGTLLFGLRGSSPSVLLYDTGAELVEGLLAASRVSSLHPGLPIVVAGEGLRLRSKEGLRLVDRRTSTESIVDEVELAHIGIPAFVEEPLREMAPADLAGHAVIHP